MNTIASVNFTVNIWNAGNSSSSRSQVFLNITASVDPNWILWQEQNAAAANITRYIYWKTALIPIYPAKLTPPDASGIPPANEFTLEYSDGKCTMNSLVVPVRRPRKAVCTCLDCTGR